MSSNDAVLLLLRRFPILKERVDDPNELFEMPHVTYGLLATEALENIHDESLFGHLCQFIDELANSGDELLEEFLVLDILEGIAQNPDLATKVRSQASPKAKQFLVRVEREFFGRSI